MVTECCLISLLNAIFKIITKVLANHLPPYIHLLVDQVQLAFTKNHFIIDSVTCAHEMLATSHNYDMEAVFLLRKLLIPFVGIFSWSCSRQEDSDEDGSVGSKLVCSMGPHLFLLMTNRRIIFNVTKIFGKETLSPLFSSSSLSIPSPKSSHWPTTMVPYKELAHSLDRMGL